MRSGPLSTRRALGARSFAVSLLAAGLVAGCGDDVQECFDDRSCDDGERCVIEAVGDPGVCAPCDAAETPYNGVDDDCNPRTRDLDLDGDGQNAIDSSFDPGLDCDDSDPLTFDGAQEMCGDDKDNDCDGEVDERDCADLEAPTVRFLTPQDGATISGATPLRVQIDDDVGAVELVIRANNAEVGRIMMEPVTSQTQEITLATRSLRDGSITLRAVATDLRGEEASAVITVVVDNSTPPEISVGNPVADRVYGGYLTATATVTDPSGVDRVIFEIEGVVSATVTDAPYALRVDTSSLSDGEYDLSIRAFDVNQSQTTRTVPFVVDNTPPLVAFTQPTNGQVVSGLLDVTVTATDASDVLGVSVGTNSGGSPLSFSVDTNRLVNGTYGFTATATDTAIVDDGARPGNVGTAAVTFTVDNIDPTPSVTWVQPVNADGVLGPTPLEVDVVSPVGNPIASVEFTVGATTTAPYVAQTPPYLVTHDFSVNTGTVSVVATAYDDQGNRASASIVVEVVPLPTFRISEQVPVSGSLSVNSGLAVGDLDGDGTVDVVVAGQDLTSFTGTVTADGHWAPASVFTASGQSLADVRIADVDADGVLDAIGFGANGYSVYLGQGDGTFVTGTSGTFPQSSLRAFEVADLDGDADPDLVAVGGNTSGIVGYTYINDGTGSFTLGQNLGGDSGASDVALADIDADGDTDVIVGRSATAVFTIYFNGSTGNFGAGQDTATFGPMQHVAVADVNGNGNLDVIIDLGVGFQTFPVLSTNPFQISTGVAVAAPGGSMDGFALGDVVGDALNDVIVARPSAHGMAVIENGVQSPTAFGFDEAYVAANGFRAPKLVDLDGDNALDLVGLSPSNGTLVWARNLGNGKFLAAVSVPAPVYTDANGNQTVLTPVGLATGDVLGSTNVDLVVTFDGVQQVPPQFSVYENVGAGVNLNTSGELDPGLDPPTIVSLGGTTPVNKNYIMVGTNAVVGTNSRVTASLISVSPAMATNLLVDNPTDIRFGDVDNDTVEEIIFALDRMGAANDGSLVVEAGTFAPVGAGLYTFGEGASSIAVANLDGDPAGMLDYAIANRASENITVQIWNGSGFTNTQYNAPSGLGPITTGLVNADNRVDIVGIAGGNVVFVMEGDPNFGFRTPITYPAGNSPTRLSGGDYNGDGLYDIMTMNSNDRASLLLARPQGGFFPPIPYDLGAGPVDFRTVDFDNDGREDIIAVHSGDRSIMMIFNNADSL